MFMPFLMPERKRRKNVKNQTCRGLAIGWFPKRVVLADVPPERKPERGYIQMFPPERTPERGYVRMFPRNENRNKGTFAKTTLLRNRPFVPGDTRKRFLDLEI